MNEFEAQRAARIAENRQRLEALGIPEAAQQLVPKKPMRWKQPSNKSRAAPVVDPVATRASKRIRGQPVDTTTAQVCVYNAGLLQMLITTVVTLKTHCIKRL